MVAIDARAADGGFDFGAGADDAGVLSRRAMSASSKRATLRGVEILEGFAEGVALAQDHDPGKAGLKAFEHEGFPEGAAVEIRERPIPGHGRRDRGDRSLPRSSVGVGRRWLESMVCLGLSRINPWAIEWPEQYYRWVHQDNSEMPGRVGGFDKSWTSYEGDREAAGVGAA
jgi:hypothetical protein